MAFIILLRMNLVWGHFSKMKYGKKEKEVREQEERVQVKRARREKR